MLIVTHLVKEIPRLLWKLTHSQQPASGITLYFSAYHAIKVEIKNFPSVQLSTTP
jgi:hypothetical protein